MCLWNKIKTNLNDVAVVGPQFLIRHPSWVRGDGATAFRDAAIDAIDFRVEKSDTAAVRQTFGDNAYDIDQVPAPHARQMSHYCAILGEGRKPVIADGGADIATPSQWFQRNVFQGSDCRGRTRTRII